ncbi:hypothetical protein CDAR_510891 [Caerostris darwini]|uniref:Uncharacterized protein n=1 Tax=Caerostris darwini TaxID=1538125 RepID=A0AAV4TAR8_9ARAC|nr:hypothetical protein CDAR_510891 [Caerostris darwini]
MDKVEVLWRMSALHLGKSLEDRSGKPAKDVCNNLARLKNMSGEKDGVKDKECHQEIVDLGEDAPRLIWDDPNALENEKSRMSKETSVLPVFSNKQILQPPLSPDDDAKDDDEVGCVLWIIVFIVFHLTLFVVIISCV